MEDSQEIQEGQVIDEASPSATDERIAELETQLEQARQEAAENWNKYLRERAEMENFASGKSELRQIVYSVKRKPCFRIYSA